jgi:hypothetical protein
MLPNGAKKVKFSLVITISPGSFPTGRLNLDSPKMIRPTNRKTTPIKMNALPKFHMMVNPPQQV